MKIDINLSLFEPCLLHQMKHFLEWSFFMLKINAFRNSIRFKPLWSTQLLKIHWMNLCISRKLISRLTSKWHFSRNISRHWSKWKKKWISSTFSIDCRKTPFIWDVGKSEHTFRNDLVSWVASAMSLRFYSDICQPNSCNIASFPSLCHSDRMADNEIISRIIKYREMGFCWCSHFMKIGSIIMPRLDDWIGKIVMNTCQLILFHEWYRKKYGE